MSRKAVRRSLAAWEERTRKVCLLAAKKKVYLEIISVAQLYRHSRLPPNKHYGYIGGPRVSPIAEKVRSMLLNGLLIGRTSAVLNAKSVQPLVEYIATTRRWSPHERAAVAQAVKSFFEVPVSYIGVFF